MKCATCGADNKPGQRFCSQCGSSLLRVCAACGSAHDEGARFCGNCGSPLDAVTAQAGRPLPGATPVAATAPNAAPMAERRLVSVLFADLVGFTPLSEKRDAEEVRELLTRYFDTCRSVVNRYGGVVEKFIGDAVMAVWGAPVRTRTTLSAPCAPRWTWSTQWTALGVEIGRPELRARAGVLTGDAAVTLGAKVAGDGRRRPREHRLADPSRGHSRADRAGG